VPLFLLILQCSLAVRENRWFWLTRRCAPAATGIQFMESDWSESK